MDDISENVSLMFQAGNSQNPLPKGIAMSGEDEKSHAINQKSHLDPNSLTVKRWYMWLG